MFTPTEYINASMAFLTYAGESFAIDSSTVFKTAQRLNEILPTYPHLNNDWQIVWGPALYCSDALAKRQANLSFVAQSRSNPSNYIVATRGTNSDNPWEWLVEDFDVHFTPWVTPTPITPTPHISQATATALKIVLNTVPPTATPEGYAPLPQAGVSLVNYLASLTQNGAINIQFTGHSLGGAIAAGLALWFKQTQGTTPLPHNEIYSPMPLWDKNSVAKLSCVTFAGASLGEKVFNRYFEQHLGNDYVRVYNTNDVVPHGFAELHKLPSLYAPKISMSFAERLSLGALQSWVNIAQCRVRSSYENLPNPKPFTCPLEPVLPFYGAQLGFQHVNAYQQLFKLPAKI
ncbi:MAG: hypothetical protein PHP00_08500 [Thiotrichaceae bacterium]|nr:hypothetical protein [Thiotrichaceae bacterium]